MKNFREILEEDTNEVLKDQKAIEKKINKHLKGRKISSKWVGGLSNSELESKFNKSKDAVFTIEDEENEIFLGIITKLFTGKYFHGTPEFDYIFWTKKGSKKITNLGATKMIQDNGRAFQELKF